MILASSLEAIVESCYLSETLTEKTGHAKIFINPRGTINYIINKIVILGDLHTETSVINTLINNGNTIITRVYIPGLNYQPYINRINFDVMWNGEVITCPDSKKSNSRDILDWIWKEGDFSHGCKFGKKIKLYFPKIMGVDRTELVDTKGNLTTLGWLLQQVGINVDQETKYKDLDLMKTKKLLI